MQFLPKDMDRLKIDYPKYGKRGELYLLAQEMGRTPQFLARKARILGLTGFNKIKTKAHNDARDKGYQEWLKDNKPKGMTGKKHTKEFCKGLSKRSQRMWDNRTKKERDDIVIQRTKKMHESGYYDRPRFKVSWKGGWRIIAGRRIYFRSTWKPIMGDTFNSYKNRGK